MEYWPASNILLTALLCDLLYRVALLEHVPYTHGRLVLG